MMVAIGLCRWALVSGTFMTALSFSLPQRFHSANAGHFDPSVILRVNEQRSPSEPTGSPTCWGSTMN
jgi:hypothetical protein